MQLNYEKRWHYSLGIIIISLILGYVNFIHDDVRVLTELTQRENAIATKINQFTATTAFANKQISNAKLPKDLYAHLLMLVRIFNVQLITSSVKEARGYPPYKIITNLVIEGETSYLLQFIESLFQQSYLILPLDFSLDVLGNKKIHLTMDVLLEKQPVSPLAKTAKSINHLFCSSANAFNFKQQATVQEAAAFSLSTLRLGGYLQDEYERQAIIKLPNNTVTLVKIGDALGTELGRVEKIEPNNVQITLANHQSFILKN